MGLSVRKTWSGRFDYVTSGTPPISVTEVLGQSGSPGGDFNLDDGTGSGQANQVFAAAFSIAALGTQLYDLKSGNGELDVVNAALAMTAVKLIEIKITTPAAGVSIQFGPQAATNAALLFFQAATANFWVAVKDEFIQGDRIAGWALDGTHKVIALVNPSASLMAVGTIRITGTK